MHFFIQFINIKGLYMFRALLTWVGVELRSTPTLVAAQTCSDAFGTILLNMFINTYMYMCTCACEYANLNSREFL
jgi:hypothetical protein